MRLKDSDSKVMQLHWSGEAFPLFEYLKTPPLLAETYMQQDVQEHVPQIQALNRLRLDAFTENMRRQGLPFDALHMMRERALSSRTTYSDLPMMVNGATVHIRDGAQSNPLNATVNSVGNSHSTGKLRISYGFMSPKHGAFDDQRAFFSIDDRIMSRLQSLPDNKGERILRHFATMAAMAGHDYVHGTVDEMTMAHRGSTLIGQMERYENQPYRRILEPEMEMFSFIVHRQNMQVLFEQHPGMKEALVKQGVQFVGLLAEARAHLLQQVDGVEPHRHFQEERVHDCCDFLLEMYAQRMRCMLADQDPAMKPFIQAVNDYGLQPYRMSLNMTRTQLNASLNLHRCPEVSKAYEPIDGNAEDSISNALLRGHFDHIAEPRFASNVKLWKDVLSRAMHTEDKGVVTIRGYDIIRAKNGGHFPMIHDCDEILSNGEHFSTVDVVRSYLRAYNTLDLPAERVMAYKQRNAAAVKQVDDVNKAHQQHMVQHGLPDLREAVQSLLPPEGQEPAPALSQLNKMMDGVQRSLRVFARDGVVRGGRIAPESRHDQLDLRYIDASVKAAREAYGDKLEPALSHFEQALAPMREAAQQAAAEKAAKR